MKKIKRAVLIMPAAPGLNFFSHIKMPPLGLSILGALLKKMGIEVRIYCEDLSPIDWQEVALADIVGISLITNLAPGGFQIAAKTKRIAGDLNRQIFVVMGGPHATVLPEECLSFGADFVVRGEGVKTLEELIKHLQEESNSYIEILGLSYRDGEVVKHNPDRPFQDLDDVPMPDFSLIKGAERINTVPIQTSAGCPFDCEFCIIGTLCGKKIRYHSPDRIVDEIKRIELKRRLFPKSHIFVVDDNFSENVPRTLALLEAMKKAGFKKPWETQVRTSIAEQPDILSLMRDTGCFRYDLGIESFDPRVLKEYRKQQTPEEVMDDISIIKKYGRIHGFFIVGADADTPQTIRHTVNTAILCGIDTAQFFPLGPIPGSRLYQRLSQQGRLIDIDWSHCDGNHVVHLHPTMAPLEVQKLVIESYQRFYSYRQGLKWITRGEIENFLAVLYAQRIVRLWCKENKKFLMGLRNYESKIKVG